MTTPTIPDRDDYSEHAEADADHAPDHNPDTDQCRTCGLGTTSDGTRHGDDFRPEDKVARA